jgi:transposase
LAQGGAEALGKTRPGPKSAKTPEQRRIEQLEKDNARLQRKLQVTQDCVDLQKKALSMLDLSGNGDNA